MNIIFKSGVLLLWVLIARMINIYLIWQPYNKQRTVIATNIFQISSAGEFQPFRSMSQLPELTQVKYHIQRGNYAELNDKDVTFFETLVGKRNILRDTNNDLQGYNVDFYHSVRGNSKLVLKPGCTQEISEILKYCNEKHLAICPQGGNTGVAGGAVPVFDEIILSLARLNKVISVDGTAGIATCEAGCTLENLNAKTVEAGLVVPLDLGAKSSCHIGGNVSTNAGGMRLVRYGNLHGSILGLEVVLADGKILDLMSELKKDNTGYHLKHLFIGSEGTLGVVTKLSILCHPLCKSVNLIFLALNSFDSVIQTFKNAKRFLGEILSACEMMDDKSMAASCDQYNLKSPFHRRFPFYMIIETSGSNCEHDREKVNNFLKYCMEAGDVIDGTSTNEPKKMREIWQIRELIGPALNQDGYWFKYDISLPLHNFYDIVDVLEKRVGHLSKRVCGFGHLGDSNLHLNVSCTEYSLELHQLIEPFIFEYTSQVKGSISAEHGIGILKKDFLKFSKSPLAIDMMRTMKQVLDPNCILNPYKVVS